MLRDRLSEVKIGNGKQFEDFCVTEIIEEELSDFFSYVNRQEVTLDGHRRFDCCVTLKSPWTSTGLEEPWDLFQIDFNNRVVIFEFKNYKAEVDRNEVLLTSKYLVKNAKRNIAIIICRNTYSKGAQEEAISILRESGKLILLIRVDDIVDAIDKNESVSRLIRDEYLKLLTKANQ